MSRPASARHSSGALAILISQTESEIHAQHVEKALVPWLSYCPVRKQQPDSRLYATQMPACLGATAVMSFFVIELFGI